jgi:hypothetical protein
VKERGELASVLPAPSQYGSYPAAWCLSGLVSCVAMRRPISLCVDSRWSSFEHRRSSSRREMVLDEISNSLSMGLGEIVIAAVNDMKAGVRK